MGALDFSMARMKHLTWKLRLREFMDGKKVLNDNELVSHKDCDLGKWLYSDGLAKYGNIAGMKQLESEHASMHAQVKRIVHLMRAGDKAHAEEEFQKIGPQSEHIVQLLTDVEKKVGSQ